MTQGRQRGLVPWGKRTAERSPPPPKRREVAVDRVLAMSCFLREPPPYGGKARDICSPSPIWQRTTRRRGVRYVRRCAGRGQWLHDTPHTRRSLGGEASPRFMVFRKRMP